MFLVFLLNFTCTTWKTQKIHTVGKKEKEKWNQKKISLNAMHRAKYKVEHVKKSDSKQLKTEQVHKIFSIVLTIYTIYYMKSFSKSVLVVGEKSR